MLKNNNSMVITGKGFGQTNLIAIDAGGSIIEEKQVRVLPAKTVLVLQNGSSRISYACNPECMPTVQLGDDDKIVHGSGRTDLDPQRLRCGRRGRQRRRNSLSCPAGIASGRRPAVSATTSPRSPRSSRCARVDRPAARVSEGLIPA